MQNQRNIEDKTDCKPRTGYEPPGMPIPLNMDMDCLGSRVRTKERTQAIAPLKYYSELAQPKTVDQT